MSYLNRVNDIYEHIAKGEALDAFEKYYDEDVVMILEDGTEVEGKDNNREREHEFFDSVEEFHGIDVHKITSNEEEASTAVESTMDVTFKGGDRMEMAQVAVQQWKDDQIVKERFYATQNS